MCTLIVSVRQHPGTPLVVAANRDEALGRPASGPRRWPHESFVAPRDELAGGTWVGLNAHGLFVGITNRYPSEKHPERESRGALVVDALRAPDARTLHRQLSALAPRRYNTFHLLYADATAAGLTWSDGEALHQRVLEPGLHVLTERSLGGDDAGRVALVREAWPRLTPDGALPSAEALEALLATRRPDSPLDGVRVAIPGVDYGTRSGLVLFLAERLADSHLYWADGPPGATPFVQRDDLIAALR